MEGVLICFSVDNRPISLALYSLWSELDKVNVFLNTVNYTKLTVILYIVDDRKPLIPNDNCICLLTHLRAHET